MNIQMFAMHDAAYFNPRIAGGDDPLNLTIYAVIHALFDMKMMAIFSIFSGSSLW